VCVQCSLVTWLLLLSLVLLWRLHRCLPRPGNHYTLHRCRRNHRPTRRTLGLLHAAAGRRRRSSEQQQGYAAEDYEWEFAGAGRKRKRKSMQGAWLPLCVLVGAEPRLQAFTRVTALLSICAAQALPSSCRGFLPAKQRRRSSWLWPASASW
jgi:hypothetical protein